MNLDHNAAPVQGRDRGGIRRATPALRRAERLAGDWRGLPEGVTRWRLAAALRAAAKPLGLTGTLLRLVELYVDLSYDQDWAADSEPVICRPLVEIAEQMDLSERQVRNLERRLVEIGLLAFRDSGNHARRGRRDRRTGKLVYAYGPSLAPMGARAAEIVALAEHARRAVAEARRARLAISATRRRIRADLAAAAAAGVDAADLAAALDASPDRSPAGMPLQALEARLDALEDIRAALASRLGETCPPDLSSSSFDEITGRQEISGRHRTDTSKPCAINGLSIAMNKAKAGLSARPRTDGGGGAERRSDHGLSAVPLALAVAAAGPELRAALDRQEGPPSWRALTEAAREVAPLLGVDLALWGEACGRLGRGGAALAVAIIERGLARGGGEAAAPIRRPDAYLRGLLARAEAGELHLDRSLRGFALRAVDGPSPGRAVKRTGSSRRTSP